MAVQALPYPLINGIYYDFSSVELSFPGYQGQNPYPGVVSLQSLDYDDSLDPGELRGAAPQVLARTRGKYRAGGKMRLPKIEADNILLAVAEAGDLLAVSQGYLEYGALTITVQYFEPSIGELIVDNLVGFRFKKNTDNHKTGQDPLMVDMDFDLMMLVRNGKFPFSPDTLAQIYPE